MTIGRTRCLRAFDLDLVAFVHDARGTHWADFREHYPLCADCSVEVRTWTELELVLQGGAPLATTHPTPEDLLRLECGEPGLEPNYRRIVEYHVASCRPCADEIATLSAFDFSSLNAAAMHVAPGRVATPEANGRPVSQGEVLAVAAAPILADEAPEVTAATADAAAAGTAVDAVPDVESEATTATGLDHRVPAEAHLDAVAAGAAVEAAPDVEIDTEPRGAVEAAAAVVVGSEVEDHAEIQVPLVVVPDRGLLPLDALAGPPTPDEAAAAGAPGAARRLTHAMLHPAVGISLVAGILFGVWWVGELPEFPFGAPAGIVPHELPEARLALATADDAIEPAAPALPPAPVAEIEPPSTASSTEEEGLPSLEGDDDAAQLALARPEGDALGQAPGLVIPDEAADVSDAPDPWALARLDDAGPLEIVAAQLAAGLELEVPVPLTVPAGAVIQVQIKGDGAREIVERLSFPGVREVALRVPAAWLVPGMYRIEVGVVRRGPAAVQVASYALVVH